MELSLQVTTPSYCAIRWGTEHALETAGFQGFLAHFAAGVFLNLKNPRSENTPDQYSLSTVELRRDLRYIYSVTG